MCDLSQNLDFTLFLISCSSNIRDLALAISGIVGVFLLWIRTQALNKSAKAATSQAMTAETERFATQIDKAIDQLASNEIATRVHAITKLKRISHDDGELNWIIVEILTNFLRDKWPWDYKKDKNEGKKHLNP